MRRPMDRPSRRGCPRPVLAAIVGVVGCLALHGAPAVAVEQVIRRDLRASLAVPSFVARGQEFELRPTFRLSGPAITRPIPFILEMHCPSTAGGWTSCWQSVVSVSGAECRLAGNGVLECSLPSLATDGSVTPRIRLRAGTESDIHPGSATRVRLVANHPIVVTETDYYNNEVWVSTSVGDPTDLTLDPRGEWSMSKGESERVTIGFRNLGSFKVRNVKVRFSLPGFYVTDASISGSPPGWSCLVDTPNGVVTCTGDELGGASTGPTLPAARTLMMTIRPKSSLPAGTHMGVATIDPDRRIQESDETNNSLIVRVRVTN